MTRECTALQHMNFRYRGKAGPVLEGEGANELFEKGDSKILIGLFPHPTPSHLPFSRRKQDISLEKMRMTKTPILNAETFSFL